MSILLKNIIASYFHGLLMLKMRYTYFLHTVVLEILLKHKFGPLFPMLFFWFPHILLLKVHNLLT